MNWQELRETYPHSWLVIEADDAYTKDSQRIIPSLTVIASFGSDWQAAWDHYKALHHADKQREYYASSTPTAPRLDIGVIDSFWRVVP